MVDHLQRTPREAITAHGIIMSLMGPSVVLVPSRTKRVSDRSPMDDPSYEHRKLMFAINGPADFLSVMRELFQEENSDVTTNFVPNSSAQIAALKPDALIADVFIGQQAVWRRSRRW